MSEVQATATTTTTISSQAGLRKVLYSAAIAVIGLIYFMGFLVIYWLVYPYKVIEYRLNPIPVLQSIPDDVNNIPEDRPMAVFHPGDTIYILHDYCKFMDTRLEADIEIVDGVRLALPDLTSHSPVGCQRRVSQTVQVPEIFRTKEPVQIHYTLTYKVNPIRTVVYHISTEKFMVVDDQLANTE